MSAKKDELQEALDDLKAAAEGHTSIAPAIRNGPYDKEAVLGVILTRIAEGESLNSICKEDGMPGRWAFFDWVGKDPSIMARYNLALSLRADKHAEELLAIADDGTNDTYVDAEGNVRVDTDVIARSKLRVNTRQWLISKMDPKKYGDKQTIDLNTPQLTDDERRERLAELQQKLVIGRKNSVAT